MHIKTQKLYTHVDTALTEDWLWLLPKTPNRSEDEQLKNTRRCA